jgi:photosystem II stability/assembly factor-like uncharacterized protein
MSTRSSLDASLCLFPLIVAAVSGCGTSPVTLEEAPPADAGAEPRKDGATSDASGSADVTYPPHEASTGDNGSTSSDASSGDTFAPRDGTAPGDAAPPRDGSQPGDAASDAGDAPTRTDAGPGNDGGSGAPSPWRNVQIVGGGFVPGIVFHPREQNLVYARTDIGGVYRMDAVTRRWTPLLDWIGFDDWNLTGVESLALDPSDPSRLYVAAGTYTNDWAPTNGAILRSRDQGRSFDRIDLPFKLGGNMPGRSMGERLAVDPNDGRVLYLGTRSGNGLWRSLDGGATWNRVASFTATGTWSDDFFKDPVGVVWVTFDPRSGSPGSPSRIIYAGIADKGSSVFRSTDAGATWEPLAGQPSAGYLPHHGVLSARGVLYVTYSDTAGPYDGVKGDVFKFDTATSQWTSISPVPSSSTDNYFGYGGLTVDALHPDTIMVTSLNSWWPDAILFRSTDAGATWTRIWDWAGYPARSLRYAQDIAEAPWLDWGTIKTPPETTPKLGWMIGDIEIDPFDSNRMMYGTGATIYGTDDLTSWDANGGKIKLSVRAQGLEETAVIDLVSPTEGAALLSALGDIGGFRHDDVTKVPKTIMTSPTFTTCTSLDYAAKMPNFVARVGNADTANGVKSIGLSYDGGTNWFTPSSEPSHTGGGTVAVSSDATTILWSPTGGTVSYSPGGNNWTASTGIPAEARVASDRVNAKKFYGYAVGHFYVSTDGGVTFTTSAATGLPLPSAQFKAVPGIEGEVWLAGGSRTAAYGLWHSTDSGATFTKIASVDEADVIGFGKGAPGSSYMALFASAKINGVRGIFRSDDGSQTWIRLTDDLHQFGATNQALTGDPRVYGRVYVGTNGRGILYRDL